MTVSDVTGTELVSSTPKCGAKRRRSEERCGLAAGHGTDHPGWGACRLHGGATPNGRKAALRLMGEALRRQDVLEVDIEPIEGLLYPIRRVAALAAFYRGRMALLDVAGDAWVFWARAEREALSDLARWSKLALDAGVAERAVRMAERTGQELASALEDALGPLGLSAEAKAGVVERFAGRLARLEASGDDVVEGEVA